jgi:TRAP-type C4-dicarboxylate transport system substrate-binding protein
VEQHWNGELVNLIDAYDAMVKGSVDMAEYFPSMLQGRFPMDDIVAFSPQTFCYKPSLVLYQLGKEFPQMVEPYNDAKLLWRQDPGSVGFVTTKKPIKDLASSKGYKMGPTGKWSAALIDALGWVPTPVPPEDATSALQTGVQEGTGISMYLLWEFGWGPIMKYMTLPIRCDSMLVNCSMNLDVWNKLPKDVQEIIDGMKEWQVEYMDREVLKNLEESIPKAKTEFGIETTWLSAEEQDKFNKACEPVRKEFIAELESQGMPGQKLMDRFLELQEKYSDEKYKP